MIRLRRLRRPARRFLKLSGQPPHRGDDAVKPELSLIIPCYNETGRMALIQWGLRDFANRCSRFNYEIILVDDGSEDGTTAGLEAIKAKLAGLGRSNLTGVKIIRLPRNRGKGAALKAGVDQSDGAWLLTLDADMAAMPNQVLDWIDRGLVKLTIQESDKRRVYIGCREHVQSQVEDSSSRRFIGRVFNALVQAAVDIPAADSQCGFKLYPADLGRAAFADLNDFGWAHDVELCAYLNDNGIELVSLPLKWRAVGQSKIKPLSDAFTMAGVALKAGWRRYSDRALHPRKKSGEAFYEWTAWFIGGGLVLLSAAVGSAIPALILWPSAAGWRWSKSFLGPAAGFLVGLILMIGLFIAQAITAPTGLDPQALIWVGGVMWIKRQAFAAMAGSGFKGRLIWSLIFHGGDDYHVPAGRLIGWSFFTGRRRPGFCRPFWPRTRRRRPV